MIEFDLRRDEDDAATKRIIAFAGMSVQHAEFPLETIVAFNHVSLEDSDMERLNVNTQFPYCHGYLRALSFSGWGNAQYDVECIEHKMMVPEVPQHRIKRINLLEQLAIASA